jgi:hypothetical protein
MRFGSVDGGAMNFVSIRKYLDQAGPPAEPAAPAWAPLCQEWLERLQELFKDHDRADQAKPLAQLMAALQDNSPDPLGEIDRAFRSLYEMASRRLAAERQAMRSHHEELERLMSAFGEALLTLAAGSEQVGERFTKIEISLRQAARHDDLPTIRRCLNDIIDLIRAETEAHRQHTSTRLGELEREFTRARQAVARCAVGWLSRNDAQARITAAFASPAGPPAVVVVLFERLAATRARFSSAVTEEALRAFVRERAADSAIDAEIFRWNEDTLVWLVPSDAEAPPGAGLEERLSHPFEYRTLLGSRSVLLALPSRWMRGVAESPNPAVLIEEIDHFSRGGGRRW